LGVPKICPIDLSTRLLSGWRSVRTIGGTTLRREDRALVGKPVTVTLCLFQSLHGVVEIEPGSPRWDASKQGPEPLHSLVNTPVTYATLDFSVQGPDG
jgi:hypothetical protein